MTSPPTSRGAGILPIIDLTALPSPHREAAARQVAEGLVGRVIELRAGSPVRFALLRLADDEHVLVYVLHHLAADAWSVETLSHQVLAAYSAAIHGLPASGPTPWQYADWAHEQHRRLTSDGGQAQYRRRIAHLADLPVLELPGAQEQTRSPVGGIYEEFSAVPAPDVVALSDLGSSEKATVYMVLTTLFAVLLQRWSGQDDVVIGMPHAGRIHDGLDTVVGPCQDAIPLRCRISGDPSFRDLLREVRDRSLDAYADGDVRFVDLIQHLPAVYGHHPVYQASIVLQHPPSLLDPQYREQVFAREDIGDLRLGPFLDRPQGQTALDLEMMLFERDGAVEAVLAGRSDVVRESDIPLLVEDFVSIARAAAADPDQAISLLLTGRRTA